MISPVVIKTAVGIAARAASDEKARNRMIVLIVTPVAFLVFVISFSLYLITNPLSVLKVFLDAEELELVEEFQIDHGYHQNLGIYENDYLQGNGQTYEGVVFGDAGETEVVYYSQLDKRWAGASYGDSTIGRSGCGPTSMSIVISTLTGQAVDPPHMAGWSYQNGYYCSGSGSYHSLIPGAAESYGLTAKGNLTAQEIVDALKNRELVVAIMAKGHFTKNGHFIVLRGGTREGKILVADPASIERSNQEWDLSLIMNEARKGAGAGGPFWAIGKKGA